MFYSSWMPAGRLRQEKGSAWTSTRAPRRRPSGPRPGRGSTADVAAERHGHAASRRGEDEADWVARAKAWQAILADARLGGHHLAEGVRRPRRHARCEAAIFAEEAARFGVPAARSPSASAWPGRRSSPTAPTRRRTASCRRCCAARRCGASSSASRARDPTSPACRPGPSATATSGWSTARRCGPRARTTATGASCWPAPTPTQPKHRGITYFLLDMRTPGIEVRPLRQMTGASHFSEVFLTDVRGPARATWSARSNAGWGVAMTTLANERTFMGGGRRPSARAEELVALGRERGRADDPVVRQGLAAATPGPRSALPRHAGPHADQPGRPPGPEASVAQAGRRVEPQAQRRAGARRSRARPGCSPAATRRPVALAAVVPRRAVDPHRRRQRRDPAQRHRRAGARPAAEPRVDKDVPFRELAKRAREPVRRMTAMADARRGRRSSRPSSTTAAAA